MKALLSNLIILTLLATSLTNTFANNIDSVLITGGDSVHISTVANISELNYFTSRNDIVDHNKNLSLLETKSFQSENILPELHYTGEVKSSIPAATDFINHHLAVNTESSFGFSYSELITDLTERVNNPKALNQGQGTNFCWAAAFSTYILRKDPKGVAQAIINYYQTGTFTYGNISLTPDNSIIEAIGTETFAENGALNNNKVDQMLLMTLASAYKGYINFDKNYNPGDQGKATYAGRPIGAYEKLFIDFGINYRRVGSDFGWTGDNASELNSFIQDNTIFLYINSGFFFRGGKLPVNGSHYVLLEDITVDAGQVTFTYWDYGHENGRTITMSQEKFNHGTFGAIIVPTENYKNGLASLTE